MKAPITVCEKQLRADAIPKLEELLELIKSDEARVLAVIENKNFNANGPFTAKLEIAYYR